MMKKMDWDHERARRLLEEGHSNAEVAEMVGISVGTLSSWKCRERLTGQKKRTPRVKGGEAREEHYMTEEVKKVAKEARSRGLTYGELVAGKENRVEVKIPEGIDASKTASPAREPERKVFEETSDAEVNLHFALNDEEVFVRAKSATRAADILKNLAWMAEIGVAK